MSEPAAKDRIDRWLWQARFFKTRSLAARLVGEGAVRVNGERVTKSAHAIRADDVLTFVQGREIRVVRVVALAMRRGPASEAQALYADLTPEAEPAAPRVGPRPTKKDRRDMDTFREPD